MRVGDFEVKLQKWRYDGAVYPSGHRSVPGKTGCRSRDKADLSMYLGFFYVTVYNFDTTK